MKTDLGTVDESAARRREAHRRVANGVERLRRGGLILLADAEDRENEIDIACSGRHTTHAHMELFLKQASGLLCLAIDTRKAAALGLSKLPHNLKDKFTTPFAQPITYFDMPDSAVSIEGRTRTILEASNPDATGEEFAIPGHIPTLIARDGGLSERQGQTEGIVDMLRLAGEPLVGVLCEVIGPRGGMAHRDEIRDVIGMDDIPLIMLDEIRDYMDALAPASCRTRPEQRRRWSE